MDHDIKAIDWKTLASAGVRGVVLDKDNTITLPYSRTVYLPLVNSVRAALSAFGTDNVVVFSNSAGSADDVGFAEADSLSAMLGIPVLKHGGKKPDGADALKAHFGLPDASDDGLASYAMIGDRHLTDVVFGNANGMLTIKTELLSTENDNQVASIMRRYEAKYAAKLVADGLSAPDHPLANHPDIVTMLSTTPPPPKP
ncbi:HAD superfamily (subfamily IIIA) phosphatase [Thecamonas trahens ATCC 50062]|uniref:HAD superfamily (Subfamily IIIA) phosphatase n=1 Tax=Thecamonas trahens ATCC 50062 TaxID=461836 RepID=A0A0L0DPV4_THETB|nr:HAD superfamily (subfamily IIIA) phosphatase [Thecamonas trahens ATCC 50062]KNC54322.1 HAD superfamily (subfamily IIIA) phosphatase [Thecamonas trahens ATCC 50062]|eukprot:XP_013753781.1 HAD superfamily (subfamily IIIA) phosphatase [Thecamonas trahens ATCC 50062]